MSTTIPMTSQVQTITLKSIQNSQVAETDDYFGTVDEFKADGHCEAEAVKLANQLIEKARPLFFKTSGEIHLDIMNGGKDIHRVLITQCLLADHHIHTFVKNYLSATVIGSNKINPGGTSMGYKSFISSLVDVHFKFTPPNSDDVKTYKIELNTLT